MYGADESYCDTTTKRKMTHPPTTRIAGDRDDDGGGNSGSSTRGTDTRISTGRIVMETNRGASDEDTRRPGRKRTSATRKDSGCEGSVVDEWVEQETRMDQTIEQRCEVLYGMPREGKKA